MVRGLRDIRTAAVPVLLVLALAACGGTPHPEQKPASPSPAVSSRATPLPPTPRPAATSVPTVKITQVRDLRKFTVDSRDPSEPSLADAAAINDANVTSRVVGRQRGGGVAPPDGKTVQDLVRQAAENALQSKGYVVTDEASPDYAIASP